MQKVLLLLLVAVLVAFSAVRPSHRQAEADAGIAAAAAGSDHACAVLDTGGVECWGDDFYGQLGDGYGYAHQGYPVDVCASGSSPGCQYGTALGGIVGIAAGGDTTCALTATGGVKCWGNGTNGQLGDGGCCGWDWYSSDLPRDVVDLDSGVTALSTSATHTCAVTTTGGLKCWGDNTYGQLGATTTGTCGAFKYEHYPCSTTPVDVDSFASGVTAVSTGYGYTCAVTTAGGLKCWGHNSYGQLGDGTTDDSATPVDVAGLTSGVAAVSAGVSHSCALTSAGGLKCWGYNDFGQLGDGTTVDSTTPVDVIGLGSNVIAVSAGGNHTCAITNEGGIKCWGGNYRGQLGNGTTSQDPTPTPVDVLDLGGQATALAAGLSFTCALIQGAWLDCWGQNDDGQLGNGTLQWSIGWTPVDLFGVANATEVAAGGDHNCATTTGGGLKCWGSNTYGQLGDGSGGYIRRVPVDVVGLASGAAAVGAGQSYTCAVTDAGAAKCWGRNYYGQLGDGTTDDSSVPVDVVGLSSGVDAIAAGGYHTCALSTEGGVKCWGNNAYGQLGDGTTDDSPVPVDVLGLNSGVVAVSTREQHTCALTSTGGVKCWGYNAYGQLGDGTTDNSPVPVDILGLSSGVVAVSSGGWHTCVVTTAGGAKCWGSNGKGQLGDGTIISDTTPVDVVGLQTGVAGISGGGEHTCALMETGSVKCWGSNAYGQLGDGKACNREICPTPVDVCADQDCQMNLHGMSALAAGGEHTCALATTGGIKCWGRDNVSQLGNAGRGIPTHVLIDSDGDGCPNTMELQTAEGSEISGGRRSYKNPWDYFNPTGDGENRVDDILEVASHYYLAEGEPGYDQKCDRSYVGPNPWNLGPPDGRILVDDILHAVKSYFHDCGMGTQ